MKGLAPLAALLLAACGGPLGDDEDPGPELYAEHCAGCHGGDARGAEFGPDLMWRSQGLDVDDVADIIAFGEGLMDPLDLTPEEAEAVADYLLEGLLAP